MIKYKLNDSLNGVEIYFSEMPDLSVRNELKENGFRWHRVKKCWYAKQSNERLEIAKHLCGESTAKILNEKTNTVKKYGPMVKRAAIDHENLMKKRYCYAATVNEFLQETRSSWLAKMKGGFSESYLLYLGQAQINAWEDCFNVLQTQLSKEKSIENMGIIFEYSLPYESGRRPDVILISNHDVCILEFKMKNIVLRADIDQVAAYARDIREYHYKSRERLVTSVLVLSRANTINDKDGDVYICGKNNLFQVISGIVCANDLETDIKGWIESKYEPLPTIVEAARMFMKKEKLPNIRRVNSTSIPQAIEFLKKITVMAKNEKRHVISFVTGVPGAGKTFLGLQYVYDICESSTNVNSVYLSGNGPLVSVLKDALQSNVFVKDLHKQVTEYLQRGAHDFNKNVIVFDEGQRAWDKNQMFSKGRGSKSEPEVMIELCEQRTNWCVVLVLVGEGQEIYNGENAGIAQWNDALNAGDEEWLVACPDKLDNIFKTQDIIDDAFRNNLDLTVSLRSHLALNVSIFVNTVMNGKFDEAKKYVSEIKKDGFTMLITCDLEKAKQYCQDRYEGSLTKRYGLLASSRARGLKKFGVDNSFAATSLGNMNVAAWFNTSAESGISCCNLEKVATEFSIQGLELDMPIVCWGTDMILEKNKWAKYKENEPEDDDVNKYRINSYLVLLTRGRDGIIIYVPEMRELVDVYNLFVDLGFEEL